MEDQKEIEIETPPSAPAPATQPAEPPQKPPPPPPVAAAAPAPAPAPPPVVISDEECDAQLARHGWDAEAVRDHLITPMLITRAKGRRWAAYDGSSQDWFDGQIHFSLANQSEAASLWADHINTS